MSYLSFGSRDVLPTLGGSLTDDKIFNESSIPNDWAKERASESPHICLREKNAIAHVQFDDF